MWNIDEIIMKYWEAKDPRDKKNIELRCYQEFKNSEYDLTMIDYLRENDCNDLADEMEHFAKLHQKVPHRHEKRLAA